MEIYLGVLLVVSAVAFFMYWIDKVKAKHNKWRISEKALLIVPFLGGAIGGICGMYLLRHKTKHWYFVVVNIVSLVIQIALGVLIYLKVGLIYF